MNPNKHIIPLFLAVVHFFIKLLTNSIFQHIPYPNYNILLNFLYRVIRKSPRNNENSFAFKLHLKTNEKYIFQLN